MNEETKPTAGEKCPVCKGSNITYIVDTPLCWKPSPNAVRHSVSELAVLKRENERLNVINNGMMDNLKMWQSANAVFDKELTALRAENQGLVKEVEKLRLFQTNQNK